MQSTPWRLQRAIWTAFKTAKPSSRSITLPYSKPANVSRLFKPLTAQVLPQQPLTALLHSRCYSDGKKHAANQNIEDKIEHAQEKVNEAIENRARNLGSDAEPLKQDATIVHTAPESSSIVHTSERPGHVAEAAAHAQLHSHRADTTAPPARNSTTEQVQSNTTESNEASQRPLFATDHKRLPSHLTNLQSSFRHRFTHFMDNFQTHIFTASRRLNDLTGYTAIDQLKQEIESQESLVRSCRQAVRDARSAYSSTIDTRSATQKEVNDLLHRKHAWSSADLERFTSLYRSDHANEQAEQAAHEKLVEAEKNYESASQRLSKGILARYHEEQIWSDKIRQMSTWGTWSLMGLNVLLFIVFQIMVEPWRRRRLVRGFEDKVEEALRVRDERDLIMVEAGRAAAGPAMLALQDEPTTSEDLSAVTNIEILNTAEGSAVENAGDAIAAVLAESVSSAVTGGSSTQESQRERTTIEAAAEDPTTAEVLQARNANVAEVFEPVSDPAPTSLSLQPLSTTPYAKIPATLLSNLAVISQQYQAQIRSFFDARTALIITRREYTTSVLESAFVGALGMACVFWLAGVGSR